MTGKFEKSNVYKRLMKNASILWGIKESEIESIDPLVKMLFGALSKEIEEVGNTINDSDSRIFRKQAQYLIPEVNQTSIPAHTVLRLFPNTKEVLSPFEEFLFRKKVRNSSNFNRVEEHKYFFTPINKPTVYPTEILCQVQSEGIYKVSGTGKEFVQTTNLQINHNEIYLGLTCSDEYEDKISLYIDWLNEPNKALLQDQIQHLRFFHGQKELHKAFAHQDRKDPESIKEEYSAMHRIENSCQKFYEKNFVQLDIAANIKEEEMLDQFSRAVTEAGLNTDDEIVVWIKVVFPPGYSDTQISSTVILDNCVPVLNRELKHSVFRLRKESNIKKLDSSGHFVEIVKAESGTGKSYRPCPSIEMAEMAKGTYNIRPGGVGRLDERNGHDYLHYMLDLLNEEKQSFMSLDASGTITELQEMDQILQRISKKLDKVDRSGNSPFIIFRPFTSKENVHVHYWITNGQSANGIEVGSEFKVNNPSLSKNGRVINVTQSLGGVNEVSPQELLEKYKLSLMTRGTLVTREDLYQYIKANGGENINKVQIKNGVQISPEPGQGLMRTIDIHLQFKSNISADQKNYWINRLKNDLDENSSFALPFHFIVT